MHLPESLLHEPVTTHESASVSEAVHILRERGIGALFIVDEEKRPVGVITDRDLSLGCFREKLDPNATPVSKLMTSEVWALDPTTDLLRTTAFLRRHRIRRLPIVDEEKRIRAVVSADDLLAFVSSELRWASEAATTGIQGERAAFPAAAKSSRGRE
ncbi:MAG: CBS domain-containing protein [Planctomycetota bacterium]